MRDNHRRLLETLRRRQFDLRSGPAPIAAIHGGSAENTIALAREFFHHRILTTPFVPPSVPDGKGALRLILGAKLDEKGLKGLMRAMDSLSPPASPSPATVNDNVSLRPAGMVAPARILRAPHDFS
jgi:7-keto-8-aminopelargonate synthetase-like enzyme